MYDAIKDQVSLDAPNSPVPQPQSSGPTPGAPNLCSQIHTEHIKEEVLTRSKKRANDRVRLLGCVTGVLCLLVSLLLGGNALLVYLLLEATKETKTGANQTLMVAGTDDPVRVASAETHADHARFVSGGGLEPPRAHLPRRVHPFGTPPPCLAGRYQLERDHAGRARDGARAHATRAAAFHRVPQPGVPVLKDAPTLMIADYR